ncbi:MFS transporter [Actinosynnema sp. NPDC050436]|uniref:MFS transporter n=1 Tax=Actinosynnema sp. NPDC050436 TaxID=3155659 RepID=UPI0033F061A2
MLRPYRELAATPGLPSLLLWSVLGRVHLPGTPLASSFLIAGWTGSHAVAGLVGGVFAVGPGVASPLRGRAADRDPSSRLLLVTAVGYRPASAVAGPLPVLPAPGWWPLSVVVAALAGMSVPPVTQLSRASFPRPATGPARQAVFTVEASVQVLVHVVGPALTALVVAVADPRTALGVLGAFGSRAALRRAGPDEPPPRAHRAGGRTLLTDRSMVFALGTGLCVVAALVSVDVLVIAWARDLGSPALAGALTAAWGVGSVLGGLVVGGWAGEFRPARRPAVPALGVAALVPVLPPVTSSSAWVVGAVPAVGGVAIAATNARLSDLAPEGRKAEAFGWMSAFSTAGSALVLPATGWLLDDVGPAAAAGASAAAAPGAVALSTGVRVPRLGGRDVG